MSRMVVQMSTFSVYSNLDAIELSIDMIHGSCQRSRFYHKNKQTGKYKIQIDRLTRATV